MKQNVKNTIEVSSISEVQILNLMKNVANTPLVMTASIGVVLMKTSVLRALPMKIQSHQPFSVSS